MSQKELACRVHVTRNVFQEEIPITIYQKLANDPGRHEIVTWPFFWTIYYSPGLTAHIQTVALWSSLYVFDGWTRVEYAIIDLGWW